ncbi:DUF1285 domain-containing protein [Pleionea sediminis]|uniref:DUF1285 domain-containing protein n=1 Tax=Pleionea sediminis TaxID=2569479 RepID=UPI001FE5F5BE|nr:DUF1285 domain-containing protein [Pleionea sediminis]
MDLNKLASSIDADNLPPVEKWDPEYCGEIDIEIKRDGSWHYMGTPIGRQKLVKLFSTVLKKENDQYFLVTPVEKVGIRVVDAPFVAVLMDVHETNEGQALLFTDNVGNQFIAGKEHPIWVEIDPETKEPSPYIRVRRNLDALINRNVFYQLVDIAEQVEQNGKIELRVSSQGETFSLGKVEQ